MNDLVIVLTGPTGSGKTTVSKLLAKRIDKCVNIDVDHIKHMIECGFQKDIMPNGREDWKYSEWKLVGESIGLLASNFQKRGFNVIINGYIDIDGWESLCSHININYKYLLLPDMDTVKNRDNGRSEDIIMGEEAVKEHFEYFAKDYYRDYVVLDTSYQTADETAQEIERLIKTAIITVKYKLD